MHCQNVFEVWAEFELLKLYLFPLFIVITGHQLYLLGGVHKSHTPGTQMTKFSTVAPNICGSSVSNLFCVTLVSSNFELPGRFLGNLWTPAYYSNKWE
jgi:hypothetical protein